MSVKRQLLILTILLLGLVLRLHNYEKYPQRGATSDEYTYSFLGLSLLTKGIPISWSHFSGYRNRQDVTIDNIFFPIVWPYFDHPPLNGIFVGGWALLQGERKFENLTLSTIRLVPIAFSMLSTVLLFLLAYQLYQRPIAIWAMAIYATVTIFVIQGRVVLAENLLSVLFLLALYLYVRWRKEFTWVRSTSVGILCGLSLWTKEAGITVYLSLLVLATILRTTGPFRRIVSLITLLFIAIYVLYGWIYDWQTFITILTTQSVRDIGPATLNYLLSTPIIVNKIYYDGWYFFGFLSLAFLLIQWKKHVALTVPTLIYFLFLLVTLTQNQQIGWYVVPLFPFMAIATAVVLYEAITKRTWTFFLFLLLVGLPQIHHVYEEQFGLSPSAYRILFVTLMAPSLFAALFRKDTLFTTLGYAYFIFFLLLTSYLSLTYVHPV